MFFRHRNPGSEQYGDQDVWSHRCDSEVRDSLPGRTDYQPRDAPYNHDALRIGFARWGQLWRGHRHRQWYRLSIINSLSAAVLLLIFTTAGCKSQSAVVVEPKPVSLDALFSKARAN